MQLKEPLIGLWFGHFYCPAYDDKRYVQESLEKIAGLGFNTVEMDMKDWEDIRERAQGKAASPYVDMAETMLALMPQYGLSQMFLALYLNGDNLYPSIRFSPPVFGESVTNADGTDGRWYRYWSGKAQKRQTEHVRELMELYGGNHVRLPDGRLPVCSMWDPVVAPSFDGDGDARYRDFLRIRYGSIEAFNAAYHTSYTSFDGISLHEVWYAAVYGENTCYTAEERESFSPAFTMWADNMIWRSCELKAYFEAMEQELHKADAELYLMPNLSQWGHVINIDTSAKTDIGLCELWDTAMRGIDMRPVSASVDMCHYYSLPVTIEGEADPYVVSLAHAHIRSLNPGRPFLGGVFYGRFLYTDIYRFVTPEEIIGSIVGSGAEGIMAYGWGGMDDGGLLNRMDSAFMESLKRGNAWAKRVIPHLGPRKRPKVAILFPTAMALLEPLRVEGAGKRRNDLLGLYRSLCDWGYSPDIVEADDLNENMPYDVVLVAADDCAFAWHEPEAAERLRQYVLCGGKVIHGPYEGLLGEAFALGGTEISESSYLYMGEGGLAGSEKRKSYPGTPLALWKKSGRNCVSERSFGRGTVYSVGFMAGHLMASRTSPHVPQEEKNAALYPLPFMEHHVVRDIVLSCSAPAFPAMRDVEWHCFERGTIAINHRSTPVSLVGFEVVDATWQGGADSISGHSAAVLRAKAGVKEPEENT